MNKIEISGTVAYPPELIYLPSGEAKLSFQVEIEEPKLSQSGDVSTRQWKYKVVLLGEQAEELKTKDQLSVGTEVAIEGQIYTYSWKPSGQEQWLQKTEILANSVEVIGETEKLPFFEQNDLPF